MAETTQSEIVREEIAYARTTEELLLAQQKAELLQKVED